MADFAAIARRLIDKKGRTVTLVRHGSTPSDPNKPWRGISTPTDAEITGKAVFVPRTLLATTFAENVDGVLSEGEYALFAASNDTVDGVAYKLETFNVMQDHNGVEWKIVRTELIAPADTRILYMFEVRR